MIVSYSVFLMLPTKVIRISLHKVRISEFVTFLYHRVVGPYNLLPSLHISMLVLAFLSLYFYNKRLALWFGLPILLSAASVVFTKQHYILDVAAAIPLALVAFVMVVKNGR